MGLPRLLIIDDTFGRKVASGIHRDREHLCGRFLLRDVTEGSSSARQVQEPLAEAVFYRGQKPECASVGDSVENYLEGCLDKVRQGWNGRSIGESGWSMVLLDLCFYTGQVTEASDRKNSGMPAGRHGDNDRERYFGLAILRALRKKFPDLPVVMFSSMPQHDVQYLIDKEGAQAFLTREHGPEKLDEYLQKYALMPDPSGMIVGRSLGLLKVLRDARIAAMNEAAKNQNFLILGETGVGKEGLARFLHDQSPKRRERPYLTVNCPGLHPSLARSELFGVKKKTATGVDERKGVIELADGGDLFMDEIADLPAEVQPGILRFLESREIHPVGSSTVKQVNVRLIAATNADLEEMSKKKEFRSDLLNRLDIKRSFVLPPLRERAEDIPLLAEYFVRRAEQNLVESGHRRTLTPEAIEKLMAYPWPGNIRDLRTVVFGAVTHNPDVKYLHPHHFELPEAAPRVPPKDKDSADDQTPPQDDKRGGDNATQPPIVTSGGHPLALVEEVLKNARVEGLEYDALCGWYPTLRKAYAGLLWRYLRAALGETKKNKTPEQPQGEPAYQKLGQLISGNAKLSGTAAKQLLKRILKIDPETENLAKEDPFFRRFLGTENAEADTEGIGIDT